jgi:hypothetical protein
MISLRLALVSAGVSPLTEPSVSARPPTVLGADLNRSERIRPVHPTVRVTLHQQGGRVETSRCVEIQRVWWPHTAANQTATYCFERGADVLLVVSHPLPRAWHASIANLPVLCKSLRIPEHSSKAGPNEIARNTRPP